MAQNRWSTTILEATQRVPGFEDGLCGPYPLRHNPLDLDQSARWATDDKRPPMKAV